jgi:PucR C-terminal helix-turn-helix domain
MIKRSSSGTDPGMALAQANSGHHWVRELRPNASELVESVCDYETIAAATAQVGVAPVQWAVDLGARIADHTIRRFPEFGNSRAAVHTLRLGTEQVAIYLLRSLDAGQMVHNPKSTETSTMVCDYVHRRIPMDRIWAGMRCGTAWLSEEFMAACRNLVQREQRAEELEAISQTLFEYTITFAAEVGDLYRLEEEKWVASAEFARDDALRSVLEGTNTDPEETVSRTLRYSLSQNHLALVLCTSEDIDTAATELSAVATELLHAFGAANTLVVADSVNEIRAWGGFRGPVPTLGDLSDKAVPGVDISVGVGGRGVAGFRRASDEAARTANIAAAIRYRPSHILTYDQVSLLGLLVENHDKAIDFAHRELGKLAGNLAHEDTLRETVLAYFDCRHSPRAAGERLIIAKNTVIYRLKRAEELLGRSLDERPVETWTALLIAKALFQDKEATRAHRPG